MQLLVNHVNLTNNLAGFESVNIEGQLSDPVSKCYFTLDDTGSQIAVLQGQDVVVCDETITTINAKQAIPTHNYLNNNNFNYAGSGWTLSGNLSSSITFPTSGTFGASAYATIQCSNVAAGIGSAAQVVSSIYAIAGTKYCLSGSVTVTTTFTNGDTFLFLEFLDATGTTIGGTKNQISTTLGVTKRVSAIATAPAGTVSVRASIGIDTTTTTNSGVAQWTALQLEPMWFTSGPYQVSYPTPICDFLQPECATIFDGTAVRFNRIFCGTITHAKPTYEGNNRQWEVECSSLASYLETDALLNGNYVNNQDSVLINFTIGNTPHLVAQSPSNVHTSGPDFSSANKLVVVPTAIIPSLILNDSTPRELLNSLSAISGNIFGVDSYSNTFYNPPKYQKAPYGFSSTPDNMTTFPYYDYAPEFDGTQIRNIVRVSGGTYQLSVTESWHAQDGTHTEFTTSGLTYDFNSFHIPVTTPTLTVGGTSYPCALNTGQTIGSPQGLYGQNDPGVQVNPHIASGAAISYTYTYNALAYVEVEDPVSVGQYGPRYGKVNDTSLVSLASAQARAEAELAQYSQPLPTIKFKTQMMVLPGQVIPFTAPNDGYNATLLTVQDVIVRWLGNGYNEYAVTAGAYTPNLIDYLRNVQKAISRGKSQSNATIGQYALLLAAESLSFSDSLNIH